MRRATAVTVPLLLIGLLAGCGSTAGAALDPKGAGGSTTVAPSRDAAQPSASPAPAQTQPAGAASTGSYSSKEKLRAAFIAAGGECDPPPGVSNPDIVFCNDKTQLRWFPDGATRDAALEQLRGAYMYGVTVLAGPNWFALTPDPGQYQVPGSTVLKLEPAS